MHGIQGFHPPVGTVTLLARLAHGDCPFLSSRSLFDFRIPDGKQLTLATAGRLELHAGDPVEVAMPSGDRKRAYLADKAAIILAGDAFNRVLGQGEG
jgi:hypothetical protein